jgi:LasA protease
MGHPSMRRGRGARRALSALGGVWLAVLACSRSGVPIPVSSLHLPFLEPAEPGPTAFQPVASLRRTPTPDPIRGSSGAVPQPTWYAVQAGDTLGAIAARFGISLAALQARNPSVDPARLEIGQRVEIPVPDSEQPGPSFKIIPDSELVYGPGAMDFDLEGFVESQGGYLASYGQVVDGRSRTGAEVVELVSLRYSVNPRILLTVLEYTSGWVTNPSPSGYRQGFPIVYLSGRDGLYRQLTWAANELNRGYYGWRAGGSDYFTFNDGSAVRAGPGINAGTAAVQSLMAQLYSRAEWESAVGDGGLFATYETFFGYPFDWAYEPLVPADVTQPELRLPFEDGHTWYFTGGPHGAWDTGSAWGAIDFAPGSVPLGCSSSSDWVVAAAPGLIVRSDEGAVVQDLDGDGHEQTGWNIFYMHVASSDRVPFGKYLQTGDRIGHPSCEGGVSTGTHLHIARKFNGEWIAADGSVPFNLSGWISAGLGQEYDGTLTRAGVSMEACECRASTNAISP